MKNKLTTVLIIFSTIVLAGVAIFTAVRLYQLRQQPVAPNVPSSKPQAQEVSTCNLSFTLSSTTPTPTSTTTSTATSTATATATSTSTSTATATSTSTSTATATATSTSTSKPSGTATAKPTSTATAPSLPNSGSSWPTIFAASLGILVVIGGLLLAL